LESVDGLLLHPIAGETKADDIPVPVRIKSYKALLDNYFPVDRTLLSLFPAPMRFAGPREAIFHAICRKNYGCTHFIVGRDHAGVNGFYAPDAAHEIFDEFEADEIGIQTLFYHPRLCAKCGGVVTAKTCPHRNAGHDINGSEIRAMLGRGQIPSPDFMRPEVSQVLIDGLRSYRQAG
jgi:sulfate adenylyltransferase